MKDNMVFANEAVVRDVVKNFRLRLFRRETELSRLRDVGPHQQWRAVQGHSGRSAGVI